MSQIGKKLLVILLALPLILFAVFEARFFLSYWTAHRSPSRYVIPDDYRGWIVVRYGDPACPPSTPENDFAVLHVSAEPSCTSDPLPKGWAEDVFAYASRPSENLAANPASGLNRIWHKTVFAEEHPNSAMKRLVFYVGDKLTKKKLEREISRFNTTDPNV